MPWRRLTAALLTAAAILVLLGAGNLDGAHPMTATNCSTYWDSTQVRSHCTGGTGYFRPCGWQRTASNPTRLVKCKNSWAPVGTYAWVYPSSGYYFTGGFTQT
jgi:hypothetical protein